MLRNLLLMRGAFGVLFALYLLLAPVSDALRQVLGRNGAYALVDGLLALAVAVALSKEARWRWLFVLALVDALTRLVIAAVAFAYPDIEARILTSVVFFGSVITAAMALGLVGMVYVFLGRRAPAGTSRGGALPAFVASLSTLLFGIGVMFGFSSADGRRMLVGVFALALGLVFLISGWRLNSRQSA